MANQLKMAIVENIVTLYERGWSKRQVAREPGLDRETVARHLRQAVESKPASAHVDSPAPAEGSKPAIAPTGSADRDDKSKPAIASIGSDGNDGESRKTANALIGKVRQRADGASSQRAGDLSVDSSPSRWTREIPRRLAIKATATQTAFRGNFADNGELRGDQNRSNSVNKS